VLNDNQASNFAVRINTNDASAAISSLQKTWTSLEPNRPFEYFFLDESFAKLYQAEEDFKAFFTALTAMAIFIACSGLFAVASFFIKRRTKEIGIRKVLGATVSQITWLVSAEFIVIVLIANVIAWPAAYYTMQNWLSGFAYRIPVGVVSFLVAALVAIVIAASTVAVQSIRSALASPVESLRNE
jgi:putative ABC transport system permease protein